MEKGQNTKKMTRVAMGVHQYDCVRPGCGYQSFYFLVEHCTALAVLTEILYMQFQCFGASLIWRYIELENNVRMIYKVGVHLLT